jgi:large subunit ribosomal protein L10
MNKETKDLMINQLVEELSSANVVYLADAAGLNAEKTSDLRRKCFNQNISLKVVKNTLLEKAMEKVEGKDFSELYPAIKGPTAVMISEVGNAPAKLIKDFRKTSDKPILKGAYVEEAVYLGDNQLEALVNIKSREELIGEVIGLLQSPAKNVISALKGQGGKIAGIVKTLSERA